MVNPNFKHPTCNRRLASFVVFVLLVVSSSAPVRSGVLICSRNGKRQVLPILDLGNISNFAHS